MYLKKIQVIMGSSDNLDFEAESTAKTGEIKWKKDELEQKKLFHHMIATLNGLAIDIKEVYTAMLALKDSPQPWKQHIIESPKWTDRYGPDRNITDMVTNTLIAAKQLDKVWKKIQSDD